MLPDETGAGLGRTNPWLDLVRALAIALVLARHGERALQQAHGGEQTFLETIALNGWVGVDLFFGLSGYLIVRHLLRHGIGSERFSPGRYLALRALRIVPAYYAVLFLVLAGAFPLFHVPQDDFGWRVAYHLLFLQDYLPSDINIVFWSLGAEEKFYLLAPLLVLGLLKCRSLGGRLLILLALFALPTLVRTLTFVATAEPFSYAEYFTTLRSPFHLTLDGFVAGVAISVIEQARLVRSDRRGGFLLLGLGLFLLLGWMASHDFMAQITLVDAALQPPLIGLLVALVLAGSVKLAAVPMPLQRPVKGIATLSYSLYLIHYPLIPLSLAFAKPLGTAGFWALYLSLSFAAAALLHFAVEKPFLAWKDRLAAAPAGRIRSPGPQPA